MIEILREVQILKDLDAETLEVFSDNLIIKDYSADETIFCEGDSCNHIYIIVNGRVKLTKISSTGREKILHVLRENDLFGEQAMFEGGLAPKSAKTLEKSLIYQIRFDAVRQSLLNDPACADMLMKVMNLKLLQAYRQIINLSSKDTYSRLAARLFKLARDHGVETDLGLHIKAKLTQQELADYVGTSRETISRIMSDLVARQIIYIDKNKIYIKDYAAIKEIALALN